MIEAIRGKLLNTYRHIRYSPTCNRAFAIAGRMRFHAAVRSGRTIAFEIDGRMGMGAMLTHIMLVFGLCEQAGTVPIVRLTNRLYMPTGATDWFSAFFERVDVHPVDDPALPVIHIRNDTDHDVLGSPADLSLEEGRALLLRHIRFNDFLESEARTLYEESLAGRSPLGIHYRGTDKHSEAPSVARIQAIEMTRRCLAAGSYDAIFLATDEPEFEVELRAAFPHLPIVGYNRPELTQKTGEARHFAASDGYWKGVDALVNILLLARCGTVLRTASYLSGWAKVLNPAQRVVMLNKAYSDSRFPDCKIATDWPV